MGVLRKWYRWKYSGLVTVPAICGLILIIWFSYTSTLEFYDSFSCNDLMAYKIIGISLDDNPTYNEMTHDNQHHYDEILEQCKVNDIWYKDQLRIGMEDQKLLEYQPHSHFP